MLLAIYYTCDRIHLHQHQELIDMPQTFILHDLLLLSTLFFLTIQNSPPVLLHQDEKNVNANLTLTKTW